MSEASILAAVAALAGVAALRELIADHGEWLGERLRRRSRRLPEAVGSSAGAARALGLTGRIRRAGLDGRLGIRAVLVAKAAGAGLGAALWTASGTAMPLRLAIALLALCLLAGFLAPDVVLERIGRARADRMRAELADGLDLIALEAETGLSIPRAMANAAVRGSGPLADELGRAVAAIEAGDPVGVVVAGIGEACGVFELSLAGQTLARSHRLGNAVGGELRVQAAALRRERGRAIREAADRAGPKIQLVVALILVPAALLVIAAALIAHAGSLVAGLQ